MLHWLIVHAIPALFALGIVAGGGQGAPAVNLDPSLAVGAGAGAEGGEGGGKSLTDNQILDGEGQGGDEGAGERQGDEGGEGEGEEQRREEGEETRQEELEEGIDTSVPITAKELKALLANPNLSAQSKAMVRNLFYTNAALVGPAGVFPTVKAAREVASLIPDVDAARRAVEATEAIENYDNLFYSPDPANHAEFFTKLFEEEPKAAINVAVQGFQSLAQRAPEAYKSAASSVVMDVLANLRDAALEAPDDPKQQNRMKAYEVLSWALFGKPLDKALSGKSTQADPRSRELDARESALRQREQAENERTFATFHGQANDTAVESIIDNLATSVQKVIDDNKIKITPKAQERIVADAYRDIDGQMKANRDLRSAVRRALRDGKMDGEHRQRVVGLLTKHARGLMKAAVQRSFDDWTQNVLGINKGRQERQRQAASRSDITGGRPGGGKDQQRQPASRVTGRQIDYTKTSDDDILGGSVTVRR